MAVTVTKPIMLDDTGKDIKLQLEELVKKALVLQGPKGDTGDDGNGIASITKTSTAGLVDTYTITFTDETTTTFTVTNGAKGEKGDKGDSGASTWGSLTGNIDDQTDLKNALAAKQATITADNKLDYSLLANTPTIPDVSNFITKDADNLTNYTKTSDLASVATSGSYNDLSDTPTIPTVPTKVSAFTNDAGYLTEHQSLANYVTLDTAQVITGTKTFTKTVKLDVPDVDYDSKITATGTVDNNAGLCLTVTGNLTHKESGESTDYKPVIRNIGTPQKANDAATKEYVDSKIKNTVAYLVALNEDYSIYSKSADLTWAKVNPMLTDRASAACLDVSWSKTDFSKNSRFYLPLNCSQDVNEGPLVFDGYANIGGENKYIIAKLGKDNSFTLSVTDFVTDHSVYEVKENKVNSIIDNSASTDKYPNTKAVYEEFVRKPKVIWETDGSSGLLGVNATAPDDTKWQLTGLDFSPYAFVRCYIKQSNRALTNTTDANYRTPAVVVTIPLDEASKSTTDGWYFGAAYTNNVADRNVSLVVSCAIDETKTKFQVLSEHSLYGTTTGGRNDDGRYCYKIEGCYADEAEAVSAAPTGGVTSITAGQGLLGGTITSSGVINLDDDYVNDLIATYMTEHYENGNTGSY